MQELANLLPLMLKIVQNDEAACEHASFAAWRIAVGQKVGQVTRPHKLTRKTLAIAVSDSTWKKQLDNMATQIIFKMNSLLGSPLVTNLEFYIDESLRPVPQNSIEQDYPVDAKVATAAEKIKDPELRAKFLHAAGKYLYAQDQHNNSKS